MTLRRLPDEDPQNLADPAYRRRRIILQNMKDEELAIAQVEEMQAVSAVLSGKYTMTGEAFEPVEVDMQRSARNNIVQAGAAAWSARDKETYDPTDDIETYAVNASGVVNIIVFDPKGWSLFRSFKAVKDKLDTRRGSNSELETALKDLGQAVSYKGMYGDVAIVVYAGQYVEGGVQKNYLPDNTMVLGNTQARGLRTYGCIHSHPDVVQLVPSEMDRVQCDWSGVEWGIMSWPDGDFCTLGPREDRDYAGRRWVLGFADCWSLIREWFLREHGITLGDYSVPYEWWEQGENRYDDNWEAEGFVQVDPADMRPGDMIMMRIQAQVTNHAAVYLGHHEHQDNIMLHHNFGSLSARVPYGKYYRDRTVRVVRHRELMNAENTDS